MQVLVKVSLPRSACALVKIPCQMRGAAGACAPSTRVSTAIKTTAAARAVAFIGASISHGGSLRYPQQMRRLLLACAVPVVCVACGSPAPRPAQSASKPAAPALQPWALQITPSDIATGTNSAEPQLTQHKGGVVASWLEQ